MERVSYHTCERSGTRELNEGIGFTGGIYQPIGIRDPCDDFNGEGDKCPW